MVALPITVVNLVHNCQSIFLINTQKESFGRMYSHTFCHSSFGPLSFSSHTPCLAIPNATMSSTFAYRPTSISRSPSQSKPATTATPTSTPTIDVPFNCNECFGQNNTTGMTCFKNTQCIPEKYLCGIINSCTDSDSEQDDGDDNSIPCQDQLCKPTAFLPLPSPGAGKITKSGLSNCGNGGFYSLYGSVPKYTLSCVERYQDTSVQCNPWEYAAQSSCFLSTCGPGMDCLYPYDCQKVHSNDLYGICRNLNGSSGDMGDPNQSDGGVSTWHSAKDFLVQGLLIGIFCSVLSIALGVGFWHYKRRRSSMSWARSERGRSVDIDTSKHPLWITKFWRGRSRSQNTIGQVDRNTSRDSHDSVMDSDSIGGSSIDIGRSNNIVSGRWRWVRGNGRLNGMSVPGPFPEFEPPPVYYNGPELPAYEGPIETIPLQNLHDEDAIARDSTTEPSEVADPTDPLHTSDTSPATQTRYRNVVNEGRLAPQISESTITPLSPAISSADRVASLRRISSVSSMNHLDADTSESK